MTIIESIQYYLPELMQAMEETLIMMSISIFAAVLIGLPLGILLFISRENNNQGTILYQILNLLITVIRSFPYLLFVVAMIPVTRFLLGSSFGPIPASIPLSIVSIVIYARLVEQVLLDVPEDVGLLGTLIRCLHLSICQRIFARGSKKRVNPVSDDNDRQYGVLFHSDGNRWRRRNRRLCHPLWISTVRIWGHVFFHFSDDRSSF